ncbi:MAG: cation diffusion facilitator family transporter [Phycisphaerae bacterium]
MQSTSPPPAITDNELARLRHRAVMLCIVTTLTVATIEVFLGVAFRLVSVTAEGIHTAADLADSLVALVLVRLASRPADRTHPFGHGKFDSLAAIIEGSVVAVSGVWAGWRATAVLLGLAVADPRPEPITLVCMGAASVIYVVVSRRVMRLARQTHSPAVFAEAMHLRTHIYITLGLLAALAVSRAGLKWGWSFATRVDSVTALVLGTYLITVGWRIIVPGYRQLMDAALPDDEVARITAALEAFRSEFVEVHGMRTRRSGTDRHVDIHLVVDADTTVRDAHALSHRIEAALTTALPSTRLLVHIEPADGQLLEEYSTRNRVGAVFTPSENPHEREAAHGEMAARPGER